MPRWLRIALLAIGWCGVVFCVGALVVRQFTVAWQPWIIAASFARLGLLPCGLAVVVFAAARRRWFAVGAFALCVLSMAVELPGFVGSSAPDRGPGLTLLQANLRIGNATPSALVSLVRDNDVDVLTTDELTNREQRRLLSAGLGRLLPFHFTRPQPDSGAGLGMWSRYPLHDEISYAGFVPGALHARIDLPSGPVQVVAVHLLPPYPFPSGEWLHEIARLRGILGPLAGRVIVAGDFNATVDNPQFRALLDHGYRDAARTIGAGYLGTYPADRFFPPVIAIDHVLLRDAAPASLRTVALPNSDHRGLFVRVALS